MFSGDVNEAYTQLYYELDEQVKNAVNKGARVLLYHGDTDTLCNFLQGQRFAAKLGFKVSYK